MEIDTFRARPAGEWLDVVVNPQAKRREREVALAALKWLSRRKSETLKDLGLTVFAPKWGGAGVLLMRATGRSVPFHLRELKYLDVVTAVRVGSRVFPIRTAAELGDALRALRRARSEGTWAGGVTLVRDGRERRVADVGS